MVAAMPTRRTFLRDASLIGAASLTLASTRAAAALDLLGKIAYRLS